jgi:hypothetical protein
MEQIQLVRLLLGVGFLVANLRVLYQLGRFFRLRSSAILTWPSPAPPFYRLMVVVGGVLALLILYKVLFLQYGALAIFSETMMLAVFRLCDANQREDCARLLRGWGLG